MTRRPNHPLLLCAVVLNGTVALAATPITPSCGDTIGPGGSFVLTADVGPCSTDPALVVDSASLDLGGHTVSGSGTSGTGIVLVGTSARLRNGTVSGFQFDGVALTGIGQHVVRKVNSRDNGGDGFTLDAEDSTIRNCQANENGGDGFTIDSDGSRVRGNVATGNGSDGFEIESDNNRLTNNRSIENGSDGFEVDGDGNALVGNRAERNIDDGFELSGTGAVLLRNRAYSNGEDGIDASSAGNRIAESRASGNGMFDGFDDVDACISNRWRANVFATVSPSCIR